MTPVESRETKRAKSPADLADMFSDEIWRFASSQLPRREDAEDVAMEVFAAAFSHFDRVLRTDDQRVWLFAVARKKVAGHLRKKYRRAEQPLADMEVSVDSPEGSDLQEVVRNGIKSLPRPHAEALVLKYVNGLSTEEVARVIRKSLPATNSLLQRARASFRDAVGPELVGDARSTS